MATNYSLPSDQYWAALEEGEEFAAAVQCKFKEYQDSIKSSGYAEKIRRSVRMYYGIDLDGSFSTSHMMTEGGDAGEVAFVKVNDYRSLAQQLYNLITQQKIATKTKATNTNSDLMKLTRLGNGVVDYFFRSERLDRQIKRTLELAIAAMEGFMGLGWDPTTGGDVIPDPTQPGQIVQRGKLQSFVLTGLDVARDTDVEAYEECQWKIVRRLFNRWDLISQFKDLKEEILSIPASTGSLFSAEQTSSKKKQGDYIPLLTLYHEKTKALPDGRFALVLDDKRTLLKTGLPFKRVPIHRCCTTEIMKSAFGYSNLIDLMPLQEVRDVLLSALVSNNRAFALQNLWTQAGDDIETADLGGGLKHMKSKTEPVPIQLTKSAPETYTLLDKTEASMKKILSLEGAGGGVDSLSASASGAARAFVASQAVVFTSGLQESYVQLTEDVGTTLIQILQTFAQYPQIAEIVGKSNETFIKNFTGKDLKGIDGVTVEVTNGSLATTQGRAAFAELLLDKGMLENPQQVLEVYETGKVEPAVENQLSRLELVRKENEMMREGQVPRVMNSDPPMLHIPEHLAILDDPYVRNNPDQTVANAVTQHVINHLMEWQQMNDALRLVTNTPPFPFMMPPGMPAPGAPAPQGGNGNGASKVMDGSNPTLAEGQDVKGPTMPNLPENSPTTVQNAYNQIGGQ